MKKDSAAILHGYTCTSRLTHNVILQILHQRNKIGEHISYWLPFAQLVGKALTPLKLSPENFSKQIAPSDQEGKHGIIKTL